MQNPLQSGAKIKHNRNIIKTGLFDVICIIRLCLGVYFQLAFTFNAGISVFSPTQVL